MHLQHEPLERPLEEPSGGYLPKRYRNSLTSTLNDLFDELKRHGAHSAILHGSFADSQIRNDGSPRAGQRPSSPGIILEFESTLAGGEVVKYVGNRFHTWEENLRAISKAILSLRIVDRTINTNGAQFAGFKALPEANPASALTLDAAASTILRIAERVDTPEMRRMVSKDRTALQGAYRDAAKIAHPDINKGGDKLMLELQAARDLIERNL